MCHQKPVLNSLLIKFCNNILSAAFSSIKDVFQTDFCNTLEPSSILRVRYALHVYNREHSTCNFDQITNSVTIFVSVRTRINIEPIICNASSPFTWLNVDLSPSLSSKISTSIQKRNKRNVYNQFWFTYLSTNIVCICTCLKTTQNSAATSLSSSPVLISYLFFIARWFQLFFL